MVSYQFSNDYKILKPEELRGFNTLQIEGGEQEIWQKIHEGKAFVLTSTNYRYQYIINPTIKYFLEQFQPEAVTPKTVVEQLSQETGASIEQMKAIVKPFFQRMVKQNILLPQTITQPIEVVKEFIFEVGQIVENYQITTLLTQKSRAELYLAIDVVTQKTVAIKVLRKAVIPQEYLEKTIAFFKQEFKMMQLFQHQNICQFIAYHNTDNYTFGVMEYIGGISPRKVVLLPNIQLQDRLEVIQQMFEAVAHLHQKGITHGDIHSSNFLVTATNSVKLIDFGFTHHAIPLEDELAIEGGTMAYLPPECINPNSFDITKQRVNYQGEVFQLGVIAYIMLYDKKPFKSLTWKGLCEKIKYFNPPFNAYTSKGEFIPMEVSKMVRKALSKQPKDRYKNAIELMFYG